VDIARVDASATRGTSALHRAVPSAKLLAFACVLTGVVASSNVLVVFGIALSLVAVIVALGLPWRPMLVLALYPGIFAAIYAFAVATDPLSAALIIGKAVTAALVAVSLMFTTPYPQVFAPIQRVLPAVIGDALLMTYRSLFLLLEKFGHTLTAVRLRAGIVGVNPIRSAATITRALGGVLLYSIDLSQRTHDVMYLRGYDGRLAVTAQPSVSASLDRSVVLAGAVIGVTAIAWRIFWPTLNPYAWLPPLLAALLLLGALLWRAAISGRNRT
jgi:energy-coupling factor transporter transmembrane protein EcfT